MRRNMLDDIIEDAKTELLEELVGRDVHASECDDLVHEIAESFVPVYNGDLIDVAADSGTWWESVWLASSEFSIDNETPLGMIRGNIYQLINEELNVLLWAKREKTSESN